MAARVRTKLISDENMAVNKGKMIQTKAPTETRRAALSDLAGNKMHTGVVPANPSAVYKSKLPILKPAQTKTKSTLETKPRIAASKENQVPSSTLINPKPTVNSLVDKTRSLKIGAVKKSVKQVDATVSEKNDVSLKPGYGVEDIDKRDRNNIFLVAEYAKDIHTYLKVLEKSHPIQEDYLKDRAITPKMRSILIDWLVEVQQEYKLLQETLHIAVGILDTYLQNVPEVSRHHMQLIGVTALFLASKYEEIMIPSVDELVYISASAFREVDLYEMERQMFRTVNFDLSRPISLNFLRRYSKAAHAEALQHSFAKYFIELALIEYTLCHVNPSLVAAAALCLALFLTDSRNMRVLDGSLWTPTLEFYSEYKFADLRPTIKILAKLAFNAKTSPYTAVYQKYSKPKYLKVSENNALYSSRMKDLLVGAN